MDILSHLLSLPLKLLRLRLILRPHILGKSLMFDFVAPWLLTHTCGIHMERLMLKVNLLGKIHLYRLNF